MSIDTFPESPDPSDESLGDVQVDNRRRSVIAEIESWLTVDMSAQEFSIRIFGPTGLFAALSLTADERQRVTATPLYHRALERFNHLADIDDDFDADVDELNRGLRGE